MVLSSYKGIAILLRKAHGTSTAFYYVQITSNNNKKWNIIPAHDSENISGYGGKWIIFFKQAGTANNIRTVGLGGAAVGGSSYGFKPADGK